MPRNEILENLYRTDILEKNWACLIRALMEYYNADFNTINAIAEECKENSNLKAFKLCITQKLKEHLKIKEELLNLVEKAQQTRKNSGGEKDTKKTPPPIAITIITKVKDTRQ